ncbi:hypothetical protein [Streptomyces gobiensis]|uniref:hypothetical protein n=1 Tax=Streptomyces gobiensis TaxID=2875706 RepID=UPI001E58035B|nr:hypothetical protein [Streptomyces gobiensis]UGY90756.1 hypothetical protein test1122_02790 [Streptomyces gobiensis]
MSITSQDYRPYSGSLAQLARRQGDVAAHAQLLAAGVPAATIRDRCRPGGRWQRPLPGVVVLHSGPLTGEERYRAALCYATRRTASPLPAPGRAPAEAVITGAAALMLHQVRAARMCGPQMIDVLVPYRRNVRSREWVRVYRTRRFPGVAAGGRGLPVAPLLRATVDAVRHAPDPGWVRGLLHEVVQARGVSLEELGAELRSECLGTRPGVAQVLGELVAGTRSPGEGLARRVVEGAGLPRPLWKPRLYVGGEFLCVADAYWARHGVLLDVDSRAQYFSVADWERARERHRRLEETGLWVVRVTPGQLAREPGRVVAEVRAALEAGPHGPLGRVSVRG